MFRLVQDHFRTLQTMDDERFADSWYANRPRGTLRQRVAPAHL